MTTRRLAWIVAAPVLLLGGIPLALSVTQSPDDEARLSSTPAPSGLRAITQQVSPEPTSTPDLRTLPSDEDRKGNGPASYAVSGPHSYPDPSHSYAVADAVLKVTVTGVQAPERLRRQLSRDKYDVYDRAYEDGMYEQAKYQVLDIHKDKYNHFDVLGFYSIRYVSSCGRCSWGWPFIDLKENESYYLFVEQDGSLNFPDFDSFVHRGFAVWTVDSGSDSVQSFWEREPGITRTEESDFVSGLSDPENAPWNP